VSEDWDDMLARVLGENLEDVDREHGQSILAAADGEAQRRANARLLARIAEAYARRGEHA
jgi:hypothetical protein